MQKQSSFSTEYSRGRSEVLADTPSAVHASVVDGDLAACGAAFPPGNRLEAALLSDQGWRRQTEETLRRRLEAALRLENAGRAGCVLAGLLTLSCGLLPLASLVQSREAWEWAERLFRTAATLLPVSSLVGLTGSLLQWGLLGRARKFAVQLPAAGPALARRQREPIVDRDAVTLQHNLNASYTDERLGSWICMVGGWCSVLLWGVILARQAFPEAMENTGKTLLMLAGVVAALPLIAVPFAAVGSLYSWLHRKRLLRRAVRCGVAVHDPAQLSPYLKRRRPQAEAVGAYQPPTSTEVRSGNRLI